MINEAYNILVSGSYLYKLSWRLECQLADAEDALQEAFLSLIDCNFATVRAARIALMGRTKSRLINTFRQRETVADKADSLKDYLLDISFLSWYNWETSSLTEAESKVLGYILDGTRPVDIAKALKVSKAAISKAMKKIAVKVQVDEVQVKVGNMTLTEDAIINKIDKDLALSI